MEKTLKTFLAGLRPRDTRELAHDHITRLELDPDRKRVTLHVDKRYAFNAIVSQDHIKQIVAGIKRTFGADCSTTVKLDSARSLPEREKAVPHAIHYR